jgi:hypothetical protein
VKPCASTPAIWLPRPIRRPGLGADASEITTDYAEALLEFITPAETDIATTLDKLDTVHRHAYSRLGDELLWSQSMPCQLPPEEDIAIANYGSSNMGMLKHVYRRGLALRYGKAMQCIAGIHYNYSLDEQLWRVLAASRNQRSAHARPPKRASQKLPGHDPQFPPLQLAADVPVRRLAGAVDGFLRGRRTSSTPCPTTPCTCPTPPACA